MNIPGSEKTWGWTCISLFVLGIIIVVSMLNGCGTAQTQERVFTLSFTAPADDGNDPASGPVSEYRVYVHTQPITYENWNDAELLANPPTPRDPGQTQTFEISVGLDETKYVIVIACDEVPNCSEWSNQVQLDGHSPAAITDLRVE